MHIKSLTLAVPPCRLPSEASCALIGKVCSWLNGVCLSLFIIFHSDAGRRVTHTDASQHKKRNAVAQAWSVLMRCGGCRLFWDTVDYTGDTSLELARFTVDNLAAVREKLEPILPAVIKHVYQREPKAGEVDALLAIAGGGPIEGCMGDHAANEQRRHIELATLLGKPQSEIRSFG